MNRKFTLLQVYRGVAAIMVVLFHFTKLFNRQHNGLVLFNDFFDFGGYIGVDFFFVLSGFIITYNHYHDIGNSTKLLPYLIKRFFRVYPIYWLFFCVYLILLFVTQLNFFPEHNISYFIKSFFLIYQPGFPVMMVAWSLCFEVFFYCCFGCCIVLPKWFATLLSVVWLSTILIYNIHFKDALQGYPLFVFILNINVGRFLLGCMAGYFVLTYKSFASTWFLLAGIATLAFYFNINDSNWNTNALIETMSFVFIIIGSTGFGLEKNFPFKNLFIKIGDASYVLYLFHVLPISLFSRGLGLFNLSAINSFYINFYCILALVVIVCVSILIHNCLEKPLTNRLKTMLLSIPKRN